MGSSCSKLHEGGADGRGGCKPGEPVPHDADPQEAVGRKPTRQLRATQVMDKDGSEVEDLSIHKKELTMDSDTKAFIRSSIRQDRLCGLLEDADLDLVVDTMEYFEFAAHESVVKQGEVGTTFFVVMEGTLSVSVNGNVANTLTRGSTFGGLALLYQCPRTASVTSASPAGVWGASGSTFHQVLRENAQRQYTDNRKFLDSIQLFDGLPGKQKDYIAGGVFVECFEAGARVATEGEAAAAIYFAKRGELLVSAGGRVAATGELVGGASRKLAPGECFGDGELLRGENNAATLVADGKCELLCISAKHLKEVLGQDLRACLEKALVVSAVRKSPVISTFAQAQQDLIVGAMTFKGYGKDEKIEDGLRFVVVIEGSLVHRGAAIVRGDWYEEDVMVEATDSLSETRSGLNQAAGPKGCRLAILGKENFAEALKRSGLDMADNPSQAINFTRKILALRKVPVFRHLSHEQIDTVAKSLVPQTYQCSTMVVKQGEIGTNFFVIANGEVRVSIDGSVIRTMGKNACFGERALLFDEPRTANIEVISPTAEIWSVEKTVFSQIVKGKMQQQLTERIKLQDTSVTLKDLKHVKLIGAGASGTVRLVEHKTTHTRYALKRVLKKKGKIPMEVERERELLAENDHPFIMTYVKTFETEKSVYILTEVITGGELHAAIRTIPTVLSRAQAQFYSGSLVLVLEELAGRNIVYRDLKPENVMLDAQGYLKLVDFGIAKKLRDGSYKTFTVIGTPHYMAPEVLQGRGYGLEVDIWSLGVLHFEFVCGYLPFADDLDNPTEVCQAVLKEPLKFPSRYRDQSGKNLLTGLMRRKPRERLGTGINGFEDIKSQEFFRVGHKDTSVFEKIVGRELDPPVVPSGETYTDPAELASIKLDDADMLCQ